MASCLDDENELPLNVIVSFSASRFALPSIPLMILHSLVTAIFWSKVSIKYLHFLPFVYVYAVLYIIIWYWQFKRGGVSSTEVNSSIHDIPYLCWDRSLVESVTPSRMLRDAALSKTVRKIFSSLWQSVGRERFLRATSTSCLYLSQLAFFKLT